MEVFDGLSRKKNEEVNVSTKSVGEYTAHQIRIIEAWKGEKDDHRKKIRSKFHKLDQAALEKVVKMCKKYSKRKNGLILLG